MAQLTMQAPRSATPDDGRLTMDQVRWIPLVVPLTAVLMAVVGAVVLSVA